MATPIWQAGTIYSPGSLVQPASAPAQQSDQVTNGDFEAGNSGWTLDTGFSIGQFGVHFDGTWSLQWNATTTGDAINNNATEVVPGQTINANCQVQQGASSSGQAGAQVRVLWYDASDNFLSSSDGNLVDSNSHSSWKKSSVAGVAPPSAAFARFCVSAFRNSGGDALWIDTCTWDAVISGLPTGLVFKAVQAIAGYSGSSEPAWPLVNGQTVVDNEVTWEAVFATRVTWEASPILVSGGYEPNWPVVPDGAVADGTIRWVAMNWRITDAKCPQSAVIAIAAGKIFAADEDIIAFSATVNPLDWSTENDAGYIPFGLNTYGSTPVTALGLYRSNLVAFNSEAYQMWQVDPDPANMAILDASPVACLFPKSVQPVSNDLVMCTPEGIRNIGIAGASTNLQAGYFGAQVDPLVLAKIQADEIPFALFWPSMGQYWLIFDNGSAGSEVFVLTMNGGAKDQSWSRYLFPETLTDWAILEGDLYLRAGDLVWRVDPSVTIDDQLCSPEAAPVLSGEIASDFYHSLTWDFDAVPGQPVSGFRLYDADTDVLIVETAGFAYLSGYLGPSFERRYYVTAFNDAGESPHSNIVDLTTAASGIIIDIFEADGIWTKRPDLHHAVVTVIGGGGGGAGGGGGPAPSRKGGGAAGGGYLLGTIAAADLTSTVAVTVGAKGVGGASVISGSGGVGGNPGTTGGDSTFGAYITAHGGQGGLQFTGSGPGGSSGGTTASAGTVTSVTSETGGAGWKEQATLPGSTTNAGAGGGQADSVAGGTATHSGTGYFGGDGGDGGLGHMDAPGGAGEDGTNYGAGGGGGGAAGTGMVSGGPPSGKGGNGGKGVVYVVNHIGA